MNVSRIRVWVSFLIFSFWVSPCLANVVGVDTQNFNPTTSGLDFVTVQSSETLQPGVVNFGAYLNYAINSLPNYEDKTTQNRTNFRDSLLSEDLNFGVGLMRNWDMGISFPAVLRQSFRSDIQSFHGEYESTGLTEIRANTKYRFWGDQSHGVAAILSVNFSQIEDNPFTGVNPGPTINLEGAYDTTIDRYALGFNLGYRKRDPGSAVAGVPIEPLGDQVIASAAVSYLFPQYDTKLIGELFGGMPVQRQTFSSDRDVSSLELLLGAKVDVTRQLAWHVGGGTEVIHGTASPDWRIYTGLNYALGPLFGRSEKAYADLGDVKNPKLRPLDDLASDQVFNSTPPEVEDFVGRDVLFEFNSSKLHPAAYKSLKRLVDYLMRPPGFKSLVVEGHTDSIGSALYNLKLSERRAESVARALIHMGLPAYKIRARGYGESRPIADNGTYQGRALNRRVEFKIHRR
jgi:outer membrane protein OmpA-like peptidoglycan-associated protein